MAARIAVLLLLALNPLAPRPAPAVEVVGSTQATLAWEDASGPLAGYYVVVSRNGGPAEVESVSLDPLETLEGSVGETLVVQVAAFGADGVAGPLSAASEPITFVEAPPAGGGGGGGGNGNGNGNGKGKGGGGGSDGGGDDPGGDPDPGVPAVRGDFDGDGFADLLVGGAGSQRIWGMQGGHVAQQLVLPDAPAGARLVASGDFDANGTSDMLWQHPITRALTLWLLDSGIVTTSTPLDPGLPEDEDWKVAAGTGDFDGDGADDVVLFSRVLGELECWSLAGAEIAGRIRLAGHRGSWTPLAVADTDADGLSEVLWIHEVSRLLELAYADGGPPLALGELGPGWRVAGSADRDGDGADELLLHHAGSGASQAWHVDAGGLHAEDLPPAAGSFGDSGDFDADGVEDMAWSDAASGVVTLWLGTLPETEEADARLPEGSEVLPTSSGSYDGDFRERFCNPDLDRDGQVTAGDFSGIMVPCFWSEGTANAGCETSDMNMDGLVTKADADIFIMRFQGHECEE